MSDPHNVRGSSRLWDAEVRLADAYYGDDGEDKREKKQPVVYEFAGRNFRERVNPYENFGD